MILIKNGYVKTMAGPDIPGGSVLIGDDGKIAAVGETLEAVAGVQVIDAQGRLVNFENTVIVMTSNAGSDRKDGTVGFGHSVTDQTHGKAMKALSELLRPGFLNRVDEILCFNHLTEENFRAIAEIMLRELQTVLTERGITFTWDTTVLDYLTRKSYSVTYGARNLRRTIQKDIEDPLAEKILESFMTPVSGVALRAADGELKITAE